MTDEELERRLRQWRVRGPSPALRGQVLTASQPRPHRSDFVAGWVIAATVAGCLSVSAWVEQRTLRARLDTIHLETGVATQLHEAEALLGSQARDRILLSLLATEPLEERTATPVAADMEGAPPW
jgi:hypothetical protein